MLLCFMQKTNSVLIIIVMIFGCRQGEGLTFDETKEKYIYEPF